MIITIARECGAGGEVVGKLLSKKFNIPFYSWETLLDMAKEKGLYDEMPTFFTEDPMNSLIYALSINSHSTQVKQAPLKILYDLLKDTDCILIGRCGNYVFRDRGDCISIFLHGEFSKRVESMSKKWKITKTEATKRIPKMDEYRALYHKFYTSEVWGMSNYYDLTINTYRLGCEKTTDFIEAYIQQAAVPIYTKPTPSEDV